MQIQCEPADTYTIARYSAGGIYINETWYNSSVFVSAAGVVASLPMQSIVEVKAALFLSPSALLPAPEILIIGHHSVKQFLSPVEHALFLNAHIGVECMRFDAACRTFNVLLSEGRRVGALLLVDGGSCVI